MSDQRGKREDGDGRLGAEEGLGEERSQKRNMPDSPAAEGAQGGAKKRSRTDGQIISSGGGRLRAADDAFGSTDPSAEIVGKIERAARTVKILREERLSAVQTAERPVWMRANDLFDGLDDLISQIRAGRQSVGSGAAAPAAAVFAIVQTLGDHKLGDPLRDIIRLAFPAKAAPSFRSLQSMQPSVLNESREFYNARNLMVVSPTTTMPRGAYLLLESSGSGQLSEIDPDTGVHVASVNLRHLPTSPADGYFFPKTILLGNGHVLCSISGGGIFVLDWRKARQSRNIVQGEHFLPLDVSSLPGDFNSREFALDANQTVVYMVDSGHRLSQNGRVFSIRPDGQAQNLLQSWGDAVVSKLGELDFAKLGDGNSYFNLCDISHDRIGDRLLLINIGGRDTKYTKYSHTNIASVSMDVLRSARPADSATTTASPQFYVEMVLSKPSYPATAWYAHIILDATDGKAVLFARVSGSKTKPFFAQFDNALKAPQGSSREGPDAVSVVFDSLRGRVVFTDGSGLHFYDSQRP